MNLIFDWKKSFRLFVIILNFEELLKFKVDLRYKVRDVMELWKLFKQ